MSNSSMTFSCSPCNLKVQFDLQGNSEVYKKVPAQTTVNHTPSVKPDPKPVKPSQSFINMIRVLMQSKQHSITNSDYNKIRNGDTSFYIISEMTFKNFNVIKQTEPFSDQKMIEISKEGKTMVIGTESQQTEYRKTSSIELTDYNGNKLLHWKVENQNKEAFTVVKLLSPDGFLQLKLITADESTQFIYNVCELPN
ncbi:hypothetical protein [Rubrolithibacter danxiaensis]|uniref:hypothetical protein n=1 Tax=Rubrolithibacter danxiaensis TaxID=3390805 RepID=UPI003BF7F954